MDECSSLKVQLEQHVEAAAVLAAEQAVSSGSSASGDGKGLNLEDAYVVETVPMLKEKVKKLERELRMQRESGNAGSSGTDGEDDSSRVDYGAAQQVSVWSLKFDITTVLYCVFLLQYNN